MSSVPEAGSQAEVRLPVFLTEGFRTHYGGQVPECNVFLDPVLAGSMGACGEAVQIGFRAG